MELPKIDLYTTAKISPVGQVNKKDVVKVLRDSVIFFAAPILMYLGQLQGILTQNHIVVWKDLVPSLMTIGAIEGWAIGIAINFFLKFNDGKK